MYIVLISIGVILRGFLAKKVLFLISIGVAVSGCVNSGLTATDFNPAKAAPVSSVDNPLAHEFAAVCLSAKGRVDVLRREVERHGWKKADDSDLDTAGLARLRKKILKIPGGGGRFSESQTLYQKKDAGILFTLSLEERFERGSAISSICSIHADTEFLPVCASIGKYLVRPPDRNQKYESRNAHFIGWAISFGQKAANVTCEQAPESRLGDKGVSLSLITDTRGSNS